MNRKFKIGDRVRIASSRHEDYRHDMVEDGLSEKAVDRWEALLADGVTFVVSGYAQDGYIPMCELKAGTSKFPFEVDEDGLVKAQE